MRTHLDIGLMEVAARNNADKNLMCVFSHVLSKNQEWDDLTDVSSRMRNLHELLYFNTRLISEDGIFKWVFVS